jgi:dienelactone hydrolase
MIVERTQYYAKPGMTMEVLAIRRRACEVRREIGLKAGRIFVPTKVSEDGSPDVIWECTYHDATEHKADLDARAASPAFEAVRAEVRKCIDKFNRYVFEQVDASPASGMRDVDLREHEIVPREISFESAGRTLKGYFFAPPGEGPFPCMVCNHGSTIEKGTLDVARPAAAAMLAAWSIASFLPHRRGYGNSPGPAWREDVPAEAGTKEYDDQLFKRLDAESDDVIAALACVSALPQVKADHIGVMGSSFGGTNTLFAASKTDKWRCAIDFAGAAMNWEKAPGLRAGMTAALKKVAMPMFLIQAANDYSIGPTRDLAQSVSGSGQVVWSKIYPAWGVNNNEGHLFESRGMQIYAEDIHLFLERYL